MKVYRDKWIGEKMWIVIRCIVALRMRSKQVMQ